jgi:hypothetical protein
MKARAPRLMSANSSSHARRNPAHRRIRRYRLAHVLHAAAVELARGIGQEEDVARFTHPRRDVAQRSVDVAPHGIELAFEEKARPVPERPSMAGRAAALDHLALDRLEAIERPLAQGHEARQDHGRAAGNERVAQRNQVRRTAWRA